jgi:uncharacterized membrane protein
MGQGNPRVAQSVAGGTSGLEPEASMDATWVAMTWLHAVSMVGLLGYYAAMTFVVLPALSRAFDGPQLGQVIQAVSRRSRPLVIGAVVLFLVSGAWLMVSAGRYSGLGNLFASTWTTLLTVKHLLVLVLIVLAVGADRLAVAAGRAGSDESRQITLGTLELAMQGSTVLGALILLLTAAAQAS